MKKNLSIIDQNDIRFIVQGSLLIISSVLAFFDGIVSLIFLALSIFLLFYSSYYLKKAPKEDDDELSLQNENKAAKATWAKTLILIAIIALILSFLPFFNDISITLTDVSKFSYSILLFIIGFSQILMGFEFRKIEEEDTACTF